MPAESCYAFAVPLLLVFLGDRPSKNPENGNWSPLKKPPCRFSRPTAALFGAGESGRTVRTVVTQRTLGQNSGSECDGDALTYSLSYSWNNGTSWVPLAIGLDETSYILDATDPALAGSEPSQAMLELTANDGMNTVSIQMADLTLDAKKPPLVHILSPVEGDTFLDNVPVTLSASVSDPEDGDLPDEAIYWESDWDGWLDEGPTVEIEWLYGEPEAQITVTATDSDGMSASATVTINLLYRWDLMSRIGPDLTYDDHVDTEDFSYFQQCAAGPSVPYSPSTCEAADFDSDGDVDLSDFGIFQKCITGPALPINPNCTE